MKKSEKVKGKEKIAAKKKQYTKIGIIAAVLVVIAVIAGYSLLSQQGARTGDTVSIYYTGTLDDGTEFDTNIGGNVLSFVLGSGTIIPGLDEAVNGMQINESKTVWIPAEKAYGAYKESLVHVVNRSEIPQGQGTNFEVGKVYRVTNSKDGSFALIKVINETPTTITWDENHELAGKNLTYSFTLVGIRKA
jgi:peptidylprolyl isomerase